MAIPRQGRSSSTADILSIMARLASSGGQMPNLPMVPFPQQGFGGSISGRASGGGRSSGGGTAGSRGLTEVLRDADGKPIQRDWGNLSPTEAKSLAIRLDGWVDAGYTPDQLQSLVSPWNLSLKDSPYGQKKQKTRKDYQEDLTTTGSIYKSLDGMPEGKAMAQAMEIPGMEGYIHRDPGRVMPAGAQGLAGAIEEMTSLVDLQKKSPKVAKGLAERFNIHLPPVSDDPAQSIADQNKVLAAIQEQYAKAGSEKRRELEGLWAEYGGDLKVLVKNEIPLLSLGLRRAFEKTMLKKDRSYTDRGQTAFDAARQSLRDLRGAETTSWRAVEEEKTPINEQTPKWGAALDVEEERRNSVPIPAKKIVRAMRDTFRAEYDTIREIVEPTDPIQVPSGSLQGVSGAGGIQQPLSAPEVMVDPMSAQDAQAGEMQPGASMGPGDIIPGGGPGQQITLSPTEQLNAEFKEVLAQDKRLVDTQGYGFADERETQDLNSQRKTINGLFTDAAKKKKNQGFVPDPLVKTIAEELETYNNMASQMTPQPSLQQQAEMEVYIDDNGTQFSRNADGTMGSNMGPKTSINLETQKLQQAMQMEAERLELDQQKLQLETQRLQQDSQNRGEDRSQREGVDLRKSLMELQKQPSESMPFPIASPGKSAEPLINTTIDEDVLPLLPLPELQPGEGLEPMVPGVQGTWPTTLPEEMLAPQRTRRDQLIDERGSTRLTIDPFDTTKSLDDPVADGEKQALNAAMLERYASDPFTQGAMRMIQDVHQRSEAGEKISKQETELAEFAYRIITAFDNKKPVIIRTLEEANALPSGTVFQVIEKGEWRVKRVPK
jgi:hypothetical protein